MSPLFSVCPRTYGLFVFHHCERVGVDQHECHHIRCSSVVVVVVVGYNLLGLPTTGAISLGADCSSSLSPCGLDPLVLTFVLFPFISTIPVVISALPTITSTLLLLLLLLLLMVVLLKTFLTVSLG